MINQFQFQFQFRFLLSVSVLVFSSFAVAEDVDDIITNIKMRAETGSKAKWSIATSMGYSSGPVNDLTSDFRPNLNGGTGSTDFTTFSAAVAGKYAINTQHSLFAGSGGRIITPLRGDTPHGNADPKKNFHGDKVDVDNPYVNYQYLYRWWGVQSALTVSNTFYTASNLKRDGYVTNTSIGQNNLWDIGKTGLTLGVTTILSVGYFDKHTEAVKSKQSDYRVEFTPALEYRINDWMNARTDLYIFSVQHRRNKEDLFTVVRQKVVQGFTLGFAVTRDIYISPGIQWNPSEMKPDRTTTWVSANINIF